MAAAAILLTPSLTPQPGDTIWTLTFVSGNDYSEYQYAGNTDFVKVSSYEYTGLWENDAGDHVLSAGEQHTVRGPGRVVVEALGPEVAVLAWQAG